MGRRYEDTVEVRQRADGALDPTAFLWRERLYVIREVLGHWHEPTAWWEQGAARALHGEDAPVARRAGGAPAPSRALAGDQEVWRVAASAGRLAGTGTYDLGRAAPEQGWRLLRVVD